MLVNTLTNYNNINHYGYFKDQRVLQHNLRKAHFYYGNLKTPGRERMLRQAQANFDQFIDNNMVKAALLNLFKLLKKALTINSNEKDLISLTKLIANTFNNLEFEYDGKKSSYIDFQKRIYDEPDFSKKEQMSSVIQEKLNTLQEDIRYLISKRNEFAQKRGYKNYYQYQLERKYGTTETEIDSAIEKYYTENDVLALLRKREEIIAKNNNLTTEKLSPIHLRQPLCSYSGIDDCIESPQQVIDIVKKCYTSMGYNIEQLEKDDRLTLDLEQNNQKISRTFCQPLIPGYSVGICDSTYGDVCSLKALMHEMGHGMHFLNPFKWLPKTFMHHKTHITEAVAIMFESIVYKENLLENIVPKDIFQKFKEYQSLNEVSQFALLVVRAQFEKEIYTNPKQDFKELFSKLEQKYYGKIRNSDWLVPHFINAPGYMQNYIRATVLSEQIYNATRRSLGTDLHSNPNTANFLNKRVFGLGSLVNDKTLNILLNL